jgi:GT2 family glycosyltransferase
MSTVFLSVVIPTYQRNDLLTLCLDKISPERQSLDASLYEVVVTDDGSKSTAEELIKTKYPWAKWVKGPRKGPAANRNFGAKQGTGDWLVFIDDDCLPNSDLLDSYQQAIRENPMVKVFEGRIYEDRPKQRHDEESPVNETGGFLWSCNFCINKTLFVNIEGFDEGFPFAAMEDVDLHYRLKRNFVDILYVNNASVLHPWRIVTDLKVIGKREKSTAYFLLKHPEERARLNAKYYMSAFLYSLFDFATNIPNYGFKGSFYVLVRLWYIVRGLFSCMVR